MTEPMLPKSMHDSAVEAARHFGRLEAEREAMALVARIVEAAGGEVRVARKALIGDQPDIYASEDFQSNEIIYRTKRR